MKIRWDCFKQKYITSRKVIHISFSTLTSLKLWYGKCPKFQWGFAFQNHFPKAWKAIKKKTYHEDFRKDCKVKNIHISYLLKSIGPILLLLSVKNSEWNGYVLKCACVCIYMFQNRKNRKSHILSLFNFSTVATSAHFEI